MSKNVLIVDDDEINNLICTKLINNEEFASKITTFTNVESALNYLKSSTDEFPDVIFIDLNMPEKDGWSFIQEYEKLDHQSKINCKLFILSSSVDENDFLKARSFKEVRDFISKPLRSTILKEIDSKYF